jgi:hypothetical protein
MVAVCWLEKSDGANHVHHKNGDKSDNRSCNLEWVTPKKHMAECHSDIQRGYCMSEAGKQKLRELRLGSRHTKETKQKQREASLRLGCKPPSWEGKKHKPETLKKISENHGKKRPCIVDGITYGSFKEAGDATGIRPLTIRLRCLSKNFSNYQLG